MGAIEPTLSIVIPSYQRRNAIVRLLRGLDAVTGADSGVEAIVVVDGSDDGTVEALAELEEQVAFELRWTWQENQGPSTARNAGIELARSDLVWLLDDDLLIDGAALEAHRSFHGERAQPSVLSGPTWEQTSDRGFARAALRRHQRLLDNGGTITDPTDFWTGNVSMPRSVVEAVGGFETGFSGAAVEDVEFGYRLLKAGVPVAYRTSAALVHDRFRAPEATFGQQRSRGRNLVRLAELHPESLDRGPLASPTPALVGGMYRLGARSPRWYAALAHSATVVLHSPLGASPRVRRRADQLGSSAARLAGLLDADATPEVVSAFGFPKPGERAAEAHTNDVDRIAALLPAAEQETPATRPRFSIVIPTHQRRDKLRRLLESLDEAITDDRTEVVVVVDGSDDGTVEALTELESTVEFPLRWRWQDNRGASVARNVGIAMAHGDVCWLLDDDKTIDARSLAAHRSHHDAAAGPLALMGPSWLSGTASEPDYVWRTMIERFREAGGTSEPEDFRSGNTSITRSVLLDIGGFEPSFRGWGEEDVELGYRLVKHGVPIHFEAAAGSWHSRGQATVAEIRQQRERGRNLVRLARLHPEAIDRRPVGPPTPRPLRALYEAGVRWPRIYGAIGSAAGLVITQRFGSERQRRRLLRLGKAAGRIAGLLEAGGSPEMVERYGFPR